MVTYIIRRLFAAVVLLFVISMITFFIFYVFPRLGGQTTESLASQFVGKTQSPQAIEGVIHRFGFDQPIWVQYGRFIKGIFLGYDYDTGTQMAHCYAPCLGYSFKTNTLVSTSIAQWLPVTVSLAIGASILWLIFGVSVGVASALRKGSFIDRAGMITALIGVSLPVYFVGPLLALAFVVNWHIFPDPDYVAFTSNPISWFTHMLLPWIAVAFGLAALYARLTRVGMLDTMNEDFIRTARAKGLPERTVIFKHALRAALTPIVTIFGMDLGFALGGVVLAEQVFNLPGIGREAVDAVNQSDLPVIMGVTIVASAFIVLANLVVDLLYGVVDPRVRVS
ncbi:ABC transporter permease [Catenulispora sp. NF23]|uniref:ABC transporter permease n=1 Tax=Catenulispora pinistramenti TaxID=2705254 RepID=A0ABS5KYI5_9ACTN|nr:ABC transporter permease [Catenulispora pinistramenti]MBS2537772.1 ABC transporter permease [Catenulispora pinistramenti]MBS2551116.1 ABC transporter permease [Catenulispora pinistramenti]